MLHTHTQREMYKDTQAHVFLIRTAVIIMHYVHAHVPRIADRGENELDSCRHQEVCWDFFMAVLSAFLIMNCNFLCKTCFECVLLQKGH